MRMSGCFSRNGAISSGPDCDPRCKSMTARSTRRSPATLSASSTLPAISNPSVAELVIDLRVHLPRAVVVIATEGEAVVDEQVFVGDVQHRSRRRETRGE